jgi:bifunctional UDP-N-acetylglucosamine pyrophosphorylase/glucosamine-1-phosphate N-acetyltransferase
MKAVVLAAGEGSRMRPLTADTPKPMLPVAGKPIVRHTVDKLLDEVDEVILVAGYLSGQIEEEFEEEEKVEIVIQKDQRGTAHAALQAKDMVEGKTAIVNGDDIYSERALKALDKNAALVGSEVDHPGKFGVLKTSDGEVEETVEKPEKPPSNVVNTGFYVVDEKFFELLEDVEESSRGEMEITDAIEKYETPLELVKDPGWQPCSYPWQLIQANRQLLEACERRVEGEIHSSATIEGEVVVEEGAEIGPNAVIEGPAMVLSGAEVGPGSYIRPGTVLHAGAEVSNSEIKNSVLRDGTSVPHFSYVGDSYLGRDVNFGAGAKTANLRHDSASVRMEVKEQLVETGLRKLGAVIGSEAKIGVNASIKPGRKIGFSAKIDAQEKVEQNVPDGKTLKDGEIV